jgi:hypothetical protein
MKFKNNYFSLILTTIILIQVVYKSKQSKIQTIIYAYSQQAFQ